jgi:hypothetical protein
MRRLEIRKARCRVCSNRIMHDDGHGAGGLPPHPLPNDRFTSLLVSLLYATRSELKHS